jgi:hypothetical protein
MMGAAIDIGLMLADQPGVPDASRTAAFPEFSLNFTLQVVTL